MDADETIQMRPFRHDPNPTFAEYKGPDPSFKKQTIRIPQKINPGVSVNKQNT